MCSVSALALAACGDDDGGGGAGEDGGVSSGDLDELDNRIEDLSRQLNDVDRDVNELGDELGDLSSNLADLLRNVGDLDDRLTDLETPPNCSETEFCVPDGREVTKEAFEPVVRAICELELSCCTDDELALLWGAGITSVDECVDAFMSMVDNGIVPTFLEADALFDQSVLGYVVSAIHALNNPLIDIGIVPDNLAACAESIADRECPDPLADPPEHCDPEQQLEEDPCHPNNLLQGFQQEGEVCSLGAAFDGCAGDLICRFAAPLQGICAHPAEAGDSCRTHWDCDPLTTELYCDHETAQCEERGGAGDPCSYADPSFVLSGSSLDPRYYTGLIQNPDALERGCRSGHTCDPNAGECVPYCSEGWLCEDNSDCPEGLTCNFTDNPQLGDTWGIGVCRTPIPDGEPCTIVNTDLNPGHECASGRCRPGISAPYECLPALVPVGGDCTTNVAGLGNASTVCASGYCAAASTTTTDGTCAALCDLQSECPDTHFCTGIFCDLKRDNGVACNPDLRDGEDPAALWNDIVCASGFCDDGSNTTLGDGIGACAAKVAAGGACPSGQASACPDDQYCNGSNCVDFIAEDGNCSGSAAGACGPGSFCWYNSADTSFTCQPFPGVGGDCSGGQECSSYNLEECVTVGSAQQCHRYGHYPVGAECEGDGDCEHSWCRPSDSTCQQPIADGEPCDADDPALNRCGPGSYCRYSPDEDPLTYEGECTPQGRAGDPCDPRYLTGGYVFDCLGNDCGYYGGRVTCGRYSTDEESVCLPPPIVL